MSGDIGGRGATISPSEESRPPTIENDPLSADSQWQRQAACSHKRSSISAPLETAITMLARTTKSIAGGQITSPCEQEVVVAAYPCSSRRESVTPVQGADLKRSQLKHSSANNDASEECNAGEEKEEAPATSSSTAASPYLFRRVVGQVRQVDSLHDAVASGRDNSLSAQSSFDVLSIDSLLSDGSASNNNKNKNISVSNASNDSGASRSPSHRRMTLTEERNVTRAPSLRRKVCTLSGAVTATTATTSGTPNVPPAPYHATVRNAIRESIGGKSSHYWRHMYWSEQNSTASTAEGTTTCTDLRPNARSLSVNNDTISLPPNFRISSRKRFSKAPTLQCTSSEESSSSEPIQGIEFLPSINDLDNECHKSSLYKTTLHLLANDTDYQKEVVLGKRIGLYRLGKELGSGNFSKVKLGVHVLAKEKVAIKLMEKSKMDQKAQRLLMREIDNMELMHHPNIIRFFECVETLSKIYLVMEYAGGGELYTYVHKCGKLTEEVSKPIFAQLVSAVTHLHAKGISHRDIKAENVIFSQPGWVKLADFGFSCKYECGNQLNTFCGSPPYAAPELFRDQEYDGFKVDIWALGVLLFFMLVGVTPFRGETVHDLKRNILNGTYTVPDYISTFAQHLIWRMLCMSPSKRASILELKRTYWLKESKFPDSYFQLSLNPDERKLETNEVERQVWSILKNYGINEQMIREASGKGSRNSIIGMYRIVLYQCQAKDRDEERNKINNHLILLAERNRYLAARMNQQSKACTIL